MSSYNTYSDHELAALLTKGDPDVFTFLYNTYKATLYLHALRTLKEEDSARDIVQEVFTSLWEKRENFMLKTTMASYLYGAVRNRVLNIIAHQKITEKYAGSLQEFLDQGEFITDNQIREKELTEVIEREIASLPEKMREVFLLSRNSGLSHKEIGEKLKISDKTVKRQVANAVKLLRLRINLVICALVIHFF